MTICTNLQFLLYRINKCLEPGSTNFISRTFSFYFLLLFIQFIAMFVLAEIKDTIRLPPSKFGLNLQEAITNELNQKLANKV